MVRRLVEWLMVVLLVPGCGFSATVIGIGLAGGDSGGSGGRPGEVTVLESAGFLDLDEDGMAGPGDRIVVGFSGKVGMSGVEDASLVVELDPAGDLGLGAVVEAGPGAEQVTVRLGVGADLQPNGAWGVDGGSTGLNLVDGQTAVGSGGKAVVARANPVDLEGALRPRILSAMWVDGDDSCGPDGGEILRILFTAPVSLETTDPGAAFRLPVSGDSFGVGASFAGGMPVGVNPVEVILGTLPTITVTGLHEPAVTGVGSPSGVDVEGFVRDGTYDGVMAGPGVADIEPAPLWSSSGDDEAGALFGARLAPAGDVDNDTFLEVHVGALGHASSTGRVAVFGQGVSILREEWTSSGDDSIGARFGGAVAPAPLLDGDATPDILVGAPQFQGTPGAGGKVYAYPGGNLTAGLLPFWTSVGDDLAGALFGASVSARDLDAAGWGDILVGAPGPAGVSGPGKVFLYMGSLPGPSSIPDWTSTGDGQPDQRFGASVAAVPDVDGDGVDDILIGSPGYDDTGRAYLYLGQAFGVPGAAPTWVSSGDGQEGASFGLVVAAAGDVNGDGYGDVLIGAPAFDTSRSEDAGRAYLFLGGSGPGGALDAFPAWTSSGQDLPGAAFGASLAGGGDVDGDGFDDVIVGAPGTGLDRGRVFVYLGGPGGLAVTPIWIGTGESQGGAAFGSSVAFVGDLYGADGRSEVIVGAPTFDTPAVDAGRIYLYRICAP